MRKDSHFNPIGCIILISLPFIAPAQIPIPGHAGSIANGAGAALLNNPFSVCVSGNFAYIASYNSNAIEILDVTNPLSPIQKGSLTNATGGAMLSSPKSVFVSNNYAYVASYGSNALEIIDVSNPAQPLHAGSLVSGAGGATLMGPSSVYVSGNYAYVASASSNSLEIVDVTTPSSPIHYGSISHGQGGANMFAPQSVFVLGNYAYVAAADALEIVDVTNPAVPVHKAAFTNGSIYMPTSVYVSNSYAFVASKSAGALEIVDVTDPGSPLHKGSVSYSMGGLSSLPNTVYVSGNYAYVGEGNALDVVDVTNPSLPILKGSISDGSGGAMLNTIQSLFVTGNYAYIASAGSNAMEILDVTSPSSPAHAGSISDGADGALLDSPASAVVSGNFAYVVSEFSNALEIADVSNAAMPLHKGSLTNGTGGALLDHPLSVTVSGSYAYIASVNSNSLEIVDITDPSMPVHKGNIIDGAGGALLKTPNSLYVLGNNAYVVGGSNALEVIDISTPASPVHAGSIADGAGGALLKGPLSVFVSGNYAYVTSTASNALEIIDVSNPVSPMHKGSISDGAGGALLSSPTSVFVVGSYAYVASNGSSALEIIDVSNAAAPVHAGSISNGAGGALLSSPMSVFVAGNFAYVASYGNNALEIVDVSNPIVPKHAASINNGVGGAKLGSPYSICVVGNYAYVASNGSNALEIVDLFQPTPPITVDATSILPNGFTANWSEPSNSTSFQVDVSADNFNTLIVNSASTSGTSLVVTGLNPSTSYQYRVRGSNADGLSGNSNTMTVITTPAIPSINEATAVTQSSFNASWNPVVGALGYYFDLSTDAAFASLYYNNIPSSGTSINLSGLEAGTTFYYRVRSYNSTGSSPSSATVSVITIPPTPSPSYSSITQTGFLINCGYAQGATGYVIEVTASDSIMASSPSQLVSGLSPGSTYNVRVRSYNSNGSSPSSYAMSILTVSPTPKTYAATSITQNSFVFNWDYLFSVSAYYFDVSTDSTFANILSSYDNLFWDGTSPHITGLDAGITYYYRVRSYNNSGLSPSSMPISVTTVPATPTATAATSVTQTSFNANWAPATGAISYFLDIASDSSFVNLLPNYNSVPVLGTSAAVTGVSPGVIYYYRVRSSNHSGTSPSSTFGSVITIPMAPNPATSVTQNSFNVGWDPIVGANGYFLDVASDAGFANIMTSYDNLPVASTSQNVTGLGSGITYYYRIRSLTVGGTSPSSAPTSTITLPSAPAAIAATGYLSNGFTANWNTVTGATSYELDVSTDNFNTFVTGYNSKNEASNGDQITGLNATTTYQYRVRAVDPSGTSTNSNIISVTTNKLSQHIVFGPIANLTIGGATFMLSATDSSGLAINFTNSSGKVSINGNVVTAVSAGRDTITANQAGNATYYAASPVKQGFCVNPAQPTVTLSNNNTSSPVLTSSASSGNQWFLNGSPINGATSATLNISSAGTYTVQTITIDGCASVMSTDYPIIVTGDIPITQALSSYPNPSQDYIILVGVSEKITAHSVTDMVGRSTSIKLDQQGSVVTADIRTLEAGMYILRITTATEVALVKFIKE